MSKSTLDRHLVMAGMAAVASLPLVGFAKPGISASFWWSGIAEALGGVEIAE